MFLYFSCVVDVLFVPRTGEPQCNFLTIAELRRVVHGVQLWSCPYDIHTWYMDAIHVCGLCTSFRLPLYSFIEAVNLRCYMMVTQLSPHSLTLDTQWHPSTLANHPKMRAMCANLLRILQGCMLKSRKQNRNLQRTKVPQIVFFLGDECIGCLLLLPKYGPESIFRSFHTLGGGRIEVERP